MSWITGSLRLATRVASPQITQVRSRFSADITAKGPLVRRHGYKDPIDMKGTLAHDLQHPVQSLPIYRPRDVWNQQRALFGQNDYIDILGSGNVHPTRVLYKVPSWLRGFHGNEYQMLLRKRMMWKSGVFPVARPSKWKDMEKRIRYLYRFLNRKTKTNFSNR